MSEHKPDLDPNVLRRLSASASKLGFEIVDIAGLLDGIETNARKQKRDAVGLDAQAGKLATAADKVLRTGQHLSEVTQETSSTAEETMHAMRDSSASARDMAAWVQDVSHRAGDVGETLNAVKKNNQDIVSIARQVNTLAINAKIEAARAGDAGRGFSIVADAINELSQQTGTAAVQISENVEMLTQWIVTLSEEAQSISQKAELILEQTTRNDDSLQNMVGSTQDSHKQAQAILEETQKMQTALGNFRPTLNAISERTDQTTHDIVQAHARMKDLVDASEVMVQNTVGLGGKTGDVKLITFVQSAAFEISRLFDEAIAAGRITLDALFDNKYIDIPGTDPNQVKTRFTDFTDQVLPPIQEDALKLDPQVVFCAAVDKNGYLPTHNKKFSQPQGSDPVWNMANCRNRRIFDDRVGLKAGRNTEPFLLQVYRRDMGGGTFAMMKDISAPIYVGTRHWGGLRFAVKF